MTLTTEGDFDGGILTFRLYAKSLGLPREALFVTVDDRTVLTVRGGGGETITAGGGEGASWVEYNVPVGYGVHEVKWVHVHNPFGLESLPPLPPTGGGIVDGRRALRALHAASTSPDGHDQRELRRRQSRRPVEDGTGRCRRLRLDLAHFEQRRHNVRAVH